MKVEIPFIPFMLRENQHGCYFKIKAMYKGRDRKRAKDKDLEEEIWSGRVKGMRVGGESRGEERARPTSCHHLGPSSLPEDVAFK